MCILLILVLNIRAKSLNDLKVVRAGGAHVEKDREGHGPKHHRGTSWMSLSRRRGMLPPARSPDSRTSKALDASGVALKGKRAV